MLQYYVASTDKKSAHKLGEERLLSVIKVKVKLSL
jgi:hypothetical protein